MVTGVQTCALPICGLYERHKQLFVLLLTIKILVTAGLLTSADTVLFLRGGAALALPSEGWGAASARR